MNEKGHFTVDSQGTAEFTPASMPSEAPVKSGFQNGYVVGPTRESGMGAIMKPTHPRASAEGNYYVDPGGRVIDIQTGAEVTPGDGRPRLDTHAVEAYEKQR